MSDNKEKRRTGTADVKKLTRDSTFYSLGVASRVIQRKDKNNNPFWDITLMDGDGQIDGKIWGNSEWWNISGDTKYKMDPLTDEKVQKIEGCTVGLQGKVVEFRDQNQYNFNAVYYVDQEKYPPHNFVRRSPMPQETMERSFRALLESCSEPLKGFLHYLFFEKNFWKSFNSWPAAVSLHHAYVGGLLEHSLAVAALALSIARNYSATGFPVNVDVVLAGALLHDLGKLEAYRLSPAPEVTIEGNIADHIVLGYHRFATLAQEYGLDGSLTLEIGHILVSHHGSREFGSPVLPATPEALIVSMADDLDFKLFFWREQTSQLDGDKEVTEYVPLLQRRFWKGRTSNAPSPAEDDPASPES